jgi:general stress protein YciG
MHVERPLYRSEDEEDDEDMMDVDERGGEEESSDESEDEEMEAERGRWDPHVLLPLPRMA